MKLGTILLCTILSTTASAATPELKQLLHETKVAVAQSQDAAVYYNEEYLIPHVLREHDLQRTQWRTNLTVTNTGDEDADIVLTYKSLSGEQKTIQRSAPAPGKSVQYNDVLMKLFDVRQAEGCMTIDVQPDNRNIVFSATTTSKGYWQETPIVNLDTVAFGVSYVPLEPKQASSQASSDANTSIQGARIGVHNTGTDSTITVAIIDPAGYTIAHNRYDAISVEHFVVDVEKEFGIDVIDGMYAVIYDYDAYVDKRTDVRQYAYALSENANDKQLIAAQNIFRESGWHAILNVCDDTNATTTVTTINPWTLETKLYPTYWLNEQNNVMNTPLRLPPYNLFAGEAMNMSDIPSLFFQTSCATFTVATHRPSLVFAKDQHKNGSYAVAVPQNVQMSVSAQPGRYVINDVYNEIVYALHDERSYEKAAIALFSSSFFSQDVRINIHEQNSTLLSSTDHIILPYSGIAKTIQELCSCTLKNGYVVIENNSAVPTTIFSEVISTRNHDAIRKQGIKIPQ